MVQFALLQLNVARTWKNAVATQEVLMFVLVMDKRSKWSLNNPRRECHIPGSIYIHTKMHTNYTTLS